MGEIANPDPRTITDARTCIEQGFVWNETNQRCEEDNQKRERAQILDDMNTILNLQLRLKDYDEIRTLALLTDIKKLKELNIKIPYLRKPFFDYILP